MRQARPRAPHASAGQAEIAPKPWRQRMTPTRTQQIGLMMLLGVLVIIALISSRTLTP